MDTNFKALGRHLLLELYECDSNLLNNTNAIETILTESARIAEATIVETSFHHFSPYGVSGVVVIAESHITIHTWPEHDYAAIDIFTCDDEMVIDHIVDHLKVELKAKRFDQKMIRRGIGMNVKTEYV
ncbi:MAG: adenosylmethionine decarboxylase [Calditrichaceae bacterium]